MAWETRGNQRYYYTAEKVNGQAVKTYVGKGETARIIAQAEDNLNQTDKMLREHRRAEQAAQNEINAFGQSVSRTAQTVAAEALTAAGYHRHDRGAWRKRRITTEIVVSENCENYIPANEAERRRVVVDGLIETASKPQKARALACVEKYPGQIELGTGKSIMHILGLFSVGSRPVEAAIREHEVRKKRLELEGPNPTPLEKMLVESVITCWLTVDFYERQQAATFKKGSFTLQRSGFLGAKH